MYLQLNLVNGVHGVKDIVIGHVEEGSGKTLEENLFKSKTADIVLVEITESKAATLSNAQVSLSYLLLHLVNVLIKLKKILNG